MKSNDDEFVTLCINAREQACSLQEHSSDDNSEWLDSIRFPVDSTEIDEFEKLFYQQNPDIEPQPKNNPLSGCKVAIYDYVRYYTNASRGSLLSHKTHSFSTATQSKRHKLQNPSGLRACAFFAPTNCDKSAVWGLFDFLGYDCGCFLRSTRSETGRVRFSRCSLLQPEA